MLIRALGLMFAVCAGLSPWSACSQAATPPSLRLPDTVKPVRYSVELTIVPSEESFRGSIDIEIEVKKPTSIIWLNARFLTVELARIEGAGAPAQARIVPGGDDFVGFEFDQTLAPGAARLHLEYRGEISRKDTSGVFAQREGAEWYALTQFEPIRARRAFPSFDEPGYKVPWQLSLIVREEHVAVSNTTAISEMPLPGGMKRVTFAPTQPLPSYLIAFGVGPFDIVDAGKAGTKATPVRIVTPKGMAAQARYAARVTPRILELSEQYTGVPYPYEKLDSLVIPQTVGFGAMENAGLITYAMPLILAKPQDETPRFRQSYAHTAAHEIGHMWFGDLVTHAWWDDIWLNESFATWFGGEITDRFDPSWGVKIRGQIWRGEAMANDGLASARRIRQAIESNSDIANAFDGITYAKGGAVLAMFEAWMGEDKFRNAVRRYLAKHAHGNATAADFLGELSAEDGQAGTAFATFLDQAGVPLVSMRLQCDASGARLHLAQQRFLPLGSAAASAQTWQVPVCVNYKTSGADRRACTLLKTGSGELSLGAACPASFGTDTERYYHARYDGNLLQRIARPRNAAETVALIGDAGALAHNGGLSLSRALRTVQPFARSPNRHVAQSMITLLGDIRIIVPEALRADEARWVRALFGRKARSLGLNPRPDESDDARQLRPALLRFVIDAGDDRRLGAQAVVLAKRWLQNRGAIDASMVQTVLEGAARHGDRALFELFRAELQKTQDRRERNSLYAALGAFRDPALIDAALGLLLSDELDIREAMRIGWTLAEDARHGRKAYEFVQRNFDALVARLPRDAAAQFPKWGSQFCDQAARDDMEAFFRERSGKYTGGPRILAQALETISLCVDFKNKQQSSLAQFLQNKNGRGSRSRH
jgi:alanyl aminopeptidase